MSSMELTNIGNIRALFERHGFSFTKSLGQNFLVNPAICPKIAEQGGGDKNVCAIEIGTGVGVLTKELALRCKKVLAIEIDRSLQPILEETLIDFSNVEVVFGDVMQIDLAALLHEKLSGEEIIVCANLPYYITSPVIMRLLEEKLPINSVTVMVQKEAADRICAAVGTRECGALTIAVNFFSTPKKLFNVSRGSFMPAPNVDSAVIRLDITPENGLNVIDERLFFRIVKAAFAQRRKQLINPLSAELHLDKTATAALLETCNVLSTARPEQLKMQDFANIANAYSNGK